jgi:dTDP-4-amino-4,6-dideoxygalactose transaminase
MPQTIDELAFFGAPPAFDRPISTSNLVRPSLEAFLGYLKPDYAEAGKIAQGNGHAVRLLEERLAALHQVQECVSVCNGLWGIVMSIYALKIPGKTEIIMPSMTYRRMADIAAWLGMTPHFCDIDPVTLGVRAEDILPCINERTALILAPHPIVNLCDIDGIERLAYAHGLPLLFDAVEASYAVHQGKRVGAFGDAECFSMHASKFLNGFEGGYITTNNRELASKLRTIKNQGIAPDGSVQDLGVSAHLLEPHAAMTLAALDDVPRQVAANKERFLHYRELLAPIEGISLVEYDLEEERSFKNILVKLNDRWPLSRDLTLSILQAERMVVRPYYYPPLHQKKHDFPTVQGQLPHTEKAMHQYMLLPCGAFVSLDDIDRVVAYLAFLQRHGAAISEKASEMAG